MCEINCEQSRNRPLPAPSFDDDPSSTSRGRAGFGMVTECYLKWENVGLCSASTSNWKLLSSQRLRLLLPSLTRPRDKRFDTRDDAGRSADLPRASGSSFLFLVGDLTSFSLTSVLQSSTRLPSTHSHLHDDQTQGGGRDPASESEYAVSSTAQCICSACIKRSARASLPTNEQCHTIRDLHAWSLQPLRWVPTMPHAKTTHVAERSSCARHAKLEERDSRAAGRSLRQHRSLLHPRP